jgi:hypothetical protein
MAPCSSATISGAMKTFLPGSAALVCLIIFTFLPRLHADALPDGNLKFSFPRLHLELMLRPLEIVQFAASMATVERRIDQHLPKAETVPMTAGFTPKSVTNASAFLVVMLLLAIPSMLMILLLAMVLRSGWRHAHPSADKG